MAELRPGVRIEVVLWVIGTLAAFVGSFLLLVRSWPPLVQSVLRVLDDLARMPADLSDLVSVVLVWIVLLLLLLPFVGSVALLLRAGALLS